jgi:di/tricarboxylate transporter
MCSFGNEGIATVGVLFVVARGIANSGVLDLLMKYLLGSPSNVRIALMRLGAPLLLHGFFITNTPLVSIMIPIVQRWSRRIHIPPSLVCRRLGGRVVD